MFTNCWNNDKQLKFKICTVAAIWGFLTGLERAIIIPTLWLYFLKAFSPSAATHFYSWTLAAFNFSILIFDPIFGYLAFIGVRIKTLLIISNQLGIIGNIIYFVAFNPWMLLLGRFIAGVGAGCEVPLYADIVRVTTVEERTPYIITLLMFRQFGLIIGPACTLLMKDFKLKISHVIIDIYNGPGFLLSILWGLHTILVLIIYPRIKIENSHMEKTENAHLLTTSTPNTEQFNNQNGSTKININIHQNKNLADLSILTTKEKIFKFFNIISYPDYLKYPIFSNLIIIFCSYFCLIGLESVLPPMASKYFQWSEIETSWVYLGCGVSVIFVYVILKLVSNQGIEDRILLLIGLVFLTISYFWLTICLSLMNKDQPTLFICLIVGGIGFHVVGQPFCVSISESLYTKQISIEDQDRAQSILRVIINIALLIGPLVGGSMETKANFVFIILLASILISLILLIINFKNFSKEHFNNS